MVQRVLIVKTSSMGDVVHTLPALTDAMHALPDVCFDWVVEDSFAELPALHQGVEQVITVSIRRWRQHLWHTLRTAPWREVKQQFEGRDYSAVIDAQGLLKSAWIGLMVRAPRFGMDWRSAKEPISSLFYRHRLSVPREQHAVERSRQLFAAALNYPCPQGLPDYGIERSRLDFSVARPHSLVFLHATSRIDKHWPDAQWQRLCALAVAQGYHVCLPWADDLARRRAQWLAAQHEAVEALPALGLGALGGLLSGACGAVAVDTGLGHFAAALGVPCVSLYGPTDPILIGAYGDKQRHLQGGAVAGQPFTGLDASLVWQTLRPMLGACY
jgi:heptosyltransferase-1